jgi:outer membrane biosynthesis protein TonB
MTKALIIALALHLPLFSYLALGPGFGELGSGHPGQEFAGFRPVINIQFPADGKESEALESPKLAPVRNHAPTEEQDRGKEASITSLGEALEEIDPSLDWEGHSNQAARLSPAEIPTATDKLQELTSSFAGRGVENSLDPGEEAGGAAFAEVLPRIINGELRPDYPRAALRRKQEGEVIFSISIGQNGVIEEYILEEESDPLFVKSAQEYIQAIRFDMSGQTSIPFEGDFTVSYRID